MPGGNKAAGLFKYVWPFFYHQALKGLVTKWNNTQQWLDI